MHIKGKFHPPPFWPLRIDYRRKRRQKRILPLPLLHPMVTFKTCMHFFFKRAACPIPTRLWCREWAVGEMEWGEELIGLSSFAAAPSALQLSLEGRLGTPCWPQGITAGPGLPGSGIQRWNLPFCAGPISRSQSRCKCPRQRVKIKSTLRTAFSFSVRKGNLRSPPF